MQRGSNGSENLAEAVAKLCGELDHIAQDASASMRELRTEDLQEMRDQLKELKMQQAGGPEELEQHRQRNEKVKQQSLELLKRRDEKDDLVESQISDILPEDFGIDYETSTDADCSAQAGAAGGGTTGSAVVKTDGSPLGPAGLNSWDMATVERRVEQLKGELSQPSAQHQGQKLKSLIEETTSNVDRRLNSFERQLKEGQTRAMDTSRFEHLTDGIRRPLESRLSGLELQLKETRDAPSLEPRLVAVERKLREAQETKMRRRGGKRRKEGGEKRKGERKKEEDTRQLRGFEESFGAGAQRMQLTHDIYGHIYNTPFEDGGTRDLEERCELLETAMSRVSGALPRLSSELMRDWEASAAERFAEANEFQRLAQRLETMPESMERCEQEQM
eukprot:Skav204234  [mRNA]  locus=scaffold1550:253462:262434:- [translate_table: standard]